MIDKDQLIRDYKEVFGGGSGQRVLNDIKSICGQDRSSFDETTPDVNKTMFNEGKRVVYLRIMSFVNREVKK